MKVSGSSRAGRASPVRRSARGSVPSQGGFTVEAQSSVKETALISGPTALAAVDSLLVLQEVGDATTGVKKAVKRANDMLDLLEEMRLDMMGGGVPLHKLNGLIRLVESRRDGFQDPNLSALIDEVELRARVEIAKFQMNQ